MNTYCDIPPSPVLDFFAPHTRGLVWSLAPRGLSGAEVWCGRDDDTPRIAVKAWPAPVTHERLQEIHTQMQRATALPFVPQVFAGAHGTTFSWADRVWDCCAWQPGRPHFAPTLAQVEAAGAALAQLHQMWRTEPRWGLCPAVANRLRLLAECKPLWSTPPSRWPPFPHPLDSLLPEVFTICRSLTPHVIATLRSLEATPVPLQLCLRDVRADHVLFEGEDVRGIIDFGAVAVDHPAVDLARLLSDYESWDDQRVSVVMAGYQRVAGMAAFSAEDVRRLAGTGVVCSMVRWLVRLLVTQEFCADNELLVQRLSQLFRRAEAVARWL